MPIYSYDVVSGGEEAANPSVAEQEQDVMRDLLDTVSTTATRASSIAGSLLDLESRAGSVTGETGRQTNYSFSEPGNENFQTLNISQLQFHQKSSDFRILPQLQIPFPSF